ncbi:inositol monophosphatase family protein [Solicola sp. PLA-1-18]|uniref:inositol monophosphatase family protein n=1 Tax=Solicola sp. PLA-1-18 TaxID=3380532 RepID=UPI003B7932F6
MSTVDARALGDLALEVAREAAVFVADQRPVGRVDVAQTKSSPTDVVTAIDQSTEQLVRDRLEAARPGDGFLGEEGGLQPGTSSVVWVVDPIDGTVNFVYGIPHYAVSIGAEVDGEMVAGVVIDVVKGEEWTAVLGEGAYLAAHAGAERRRLQATAPPSLSQALVGTGFSYVLETRLAQAAAVTRLLAHVRDVRRIGSAALDLCALADGRLDAYVEQGLKPWDLAAAGLVARESGVLMSGVDGGPDERLTVAAPAAIDEEFCAVVRACGF